MSPAIMFLLQSEDAEPMQCWKTLYRHVQRGRKQGQSYSNENDCICCSACVCFISLCAKYKENLQWCLFI